MRPLAALAALLLTASSAFGQNALRIGALKGPTGIGMVRLVDAPPAGEALAFEAVPSADVMAAKLIAGELDAAVLPVNLAAKLQASGLKYPMVAVVGMGMLSVVTTEPAVRAFQDLKDREVHVAGQGATPEYLLRFLARRKGLEPLNLAFQLPPPEIAAALVAGRVSVAVLPEPFTTQALQGNPRARVAFTFDALWKEATGRPGYPMSVFVMREAVLKERPATARAVTAAYAASVDWVKAHPQEAGALVEKHELGLKAAVAAAAIPRCAFVFVPARTARPDVEALLSAFLSLEPKSIGGRLPGPEFYAELPR